MQTFSLVVMTVAALTSFGCKKKGGAGDVMAKMSELKDKMCACKDKACADKVQDEMNKWTADNAKNAGDKAEKPDEKAMKEMQDVGTKYGECMAKAMGAGDAPGPAGGSGSAAAAPPPAAGSGSAAAAPAAAGCADGAYKDPNGYYCVVIPEGFKMDAKGSRKEEGKVVDQFNSDDGYNFTITVWEQKGSTFDGMKSSESTVTDDLKMVEKLDLPNGGLYTRRRNDKDKMEFANAVIQTSDKFIQCEGGGRDERPFKPADTCKTLRSLK